MTDTLTDAPAYTDRSGATHRLPDLDRHVVDDARPRRANNAALALGLIGLATLTRKALRAPPQLGPAAMQGKSGTAKSVFVRKDADYAGSVFVDGALWQAIAQTEISEGDAIEVVTVLTGPMRLSVRRKGLS